MHGGVDRDLAAKVVLKLLILDRRRSVVRQQLGEALRGIKAQLLDRGAAVERCGDGALRQRNESDLALESPATWMPILRAPCELELLLPRLGEGCGHTLAGDGHWRLPPAGGPVFLRAPCRRS